jgi:hypothetical protein
MKPTNNLRAEAVLARQVRVGEGGVEEAEGEILKFPKLLHE